MPVPTPKITHSTPIPSLMWPIFLRVNLPRTLMSSTPFPRTNGNSTSGQSTLPHSPRTSPPWTTLPSEALRTILSIIRSSDTARLHRLPIQYSHASQDHSTQIIISHSTSPTFDQILRLISVRSINNGCSVTVHLTP